MALTMIVLGTSAVAQESRQQHFNQRYIVTTRDSAGRVVTNFVAQPPSEMSGTPIDSIRVKRNWQKLRKGMSPREVEALFGAGRVVERDFENGLEYWWYGRKAVVINSIKKKVSYWDK